MIPFTPHAYAAPRRSLAKTISWRLIAAPDTFAISSLVTGSFAWAGSIVGVEAITKVILYYVHERVWVHIPLGRPLRRAAPLVELFTQAQGAGIKRRSSRPWARCRV